MASAEDLFDFDTVTLKGDPLDRAKAALRVARLHVRLANADTNSWRFPSKCIYADLDLSI
jgi:hypothetical protein